MRWRPPAASIATCSSASSLAWIAIHSRHDDRRGGGARTSWRGLARLLRALPPTPRRRARPRPARARAAPSAWSRPPSRSFSWMGLDYDSDRTRRLTAGMAETLDFFEIPAADRLARHPRRAHRAGEERCRDENLERRQERGRDAARQTDRASAAGRRRSPASAGWRVGRAHRQPAARRASRRWPTTCSGAIRAKGLAGLEPRIDEATPLARGRSAAAARCAALSGRARRRGAARCSRTATWCASTAWSARTRFRTAPGRRRRSSAATTHRSAPGCAATSEPSTARSRASRFSTTQLRTGRGLDPRRSQTWFHHWSATHWERMTPEATARRRRDHERSATPCSSAARARPRSVERRPRRWSSWPRASCRERDWSAPDESPPRALVSPAEALMAGLAALELPARRAGARRHRPRARTGARRARRARARFGPDWRSRLAAAGPATPAANGKVGPLPRLVAELRSDRSGRTPTRRWSSASWSTSICSWSPTSAGSACPASSPPT